MNTDSPRANPTPNEPEAAIQAASPESITGIDRTAEIGVNIETTFHDLINARGDTASMKFTPSTGALSDIFGAKAFNNLHGDVKRVGDIQNCVQNNVSCGPIHSTFPVALGMKMHGVDCNVACATNGERYSIILGPNCTTTPVGALCTSDVDTAKKFVQTYPNYTSSNLTTLGVHPVLDRDFYLVSAQHPIIQAVADNNIENKNASVQPYSDGLYKIGAPLWDAVLPVIQKQIATQLTVTDYSKWNVSLHPINSKSWKEVFDQHLKQQSAGLQAEHDHHIGHASDAGAKADLERTRDGALANLRSRLLHNPLSVSCNLKVDYFFLDNRNASV
jgi:hypothetical protein